MLDLKLPGPGRDLATGEAAIANHLAMTVRIDNTLVPNNEIVHLRFKHRLEHFLGAFTGDLI